MSRTKPTATFRRSECSTRFIACTTSRLTRQGRNCTRRLNSLEVDVYPRDRAGRGSADSPTYRAAHGLKFTATVLRSTRRTSCSTSIPGAMTAISKSRVQADTKIPPSRFMRSTPAVTRLPLRVISGDKTQLDWPGAMKLNPENGDLYVANDIGQSLLVFSNISTAQGNVAPARVIKGAKTKLRLSYRHRTRSGSQGSMGFQHGKLFGDRISADGERRRGTASPDPQRPEGKRSLNFGRTTAVAYDSTREQILVPN